MAGTGITEPQITEYKQVRAIASQMPPRSENSVRRGIRHGVIAEVTKDDITGYTTGDVMYLPQIIEIAINKDQAIEPVYADNGVVDVVQAQGAVTFEITCIPPSLELRALLTGENYDSNTGALIEGIAKPKNFALGYVGYLNNGTRCYTWIYKGQFQYKQGNLTTTDSGTSYTTDSLTFTAGNTEYDVYNGESALGIHLTSTNPHSANVDFEKFMQSVITPDNIPTKATQGRSTGK